MRYQTVYRYPRVSIERLPYPLANNIPHNQNKSRNKLIMRAYQLSIVTPLINSMKKVKLRLPERKKNPTLHPFISFSIFHILTWCLLFVWYPLSILTIFAWFNWCSLNTYRGYDSLFIFFISHVHVLVLFFISDHKFNQWHLSIAFTSIIIYIAYAGSCFLCFEA